MKSLNCAKKMHRENKIVERQFYFLGTYIHATCIFVKESNMKFYIKQNKVLFIVTILVSVIASLGYVFMAILLQQLLDIAVGKDMQQFVRMVLFSIFYFAVLGIFLYLQSLLSKNSF